MPEMISEKEMESSLQNISQKNLTHLNLNDVNALSMFLFNKIKSCSVSGFETHTDL